MLPLKFSCVLFLLTLVVCKLRKFPDYIGFVYDNEITEIALDDKVKYNGPNDLWVLHLHGNIWDDMKLLAADKSEREMFNKYVRLTDERQSFHSFQSNESMKRTRRVKKDNPEKQYSDNFENILSCQGESCPQKITELRQRIVEIINKYILNANIYFDSDMDNSIFYDQNPVLKFYFHENATLMVFSIHNNEWHYVLSPPSPFSGWFYNEHRNRNTDDVNNLEEMKIPNSVLVDFLTALLPILNTIFKQPL